MEAHTPQDRLLPVQGDFATGLRTKPEKLLARGTFATGMSARNRPSLAHHGDFAAGLRSRLHDFVLPGDFARGLRTAQAAARA
ncbi:MAG TPA: hypothetical protein VMA77_26050 [Solirubrobacteraceae bacterium]|nr:hypothetical protein [Solirubrobacteraceae bacterium]